MPTALETLVRSSQGNGSQTTIVNSNYRSTKVDWMPFNAFLEAVEVDSTELKTIKAPYVRKTDGTPKDGWSVRHHKFQNTIFGIRDQYGKQHTIGDIRIVEECQKPGMSQSLREEPETWLIAQNEDCYWTLKQDNAEEAEL